MMILPEYFQIKAEYEKAIADKQQAIENIGREMEAITKAYYRKEREEVGKGNIAAPAPASKPNR